jgi:hypothetical protein
MNIASIQLTLLIGKLLPTPAPAAVMTALQSVDVTQSDTGGFQLSFLAQRSAYASMDYALLSGQLLQPGNRVVIIVTIDATPRVLMDGIITHQQFAPDSTGAMVLTVTGEDISVMMDILEITAPYPGMGDYEIVLFVLARYAALGFTPVVIPPLTGAVSLPAERIPQQSGTDRSYLQALAAEHGYIFFVRPGPVPLQNIAYWGPVNRVGLPQKALTLDAGPATNVESISFSYDGMAPTQVYGEVSDEEAETLLPILTLVSTNLPPLSSLQPLIVNQPFVRKTLLDYQGSSYIDAQTRAQAITNQSVAQVVTADGTLDVLRYGDTLTAPGIVGVRGAGFSYDGYYYVKSVSHQIRNGEYKQSFSLAREGLGSTTIGVQP